MYVVNHEEGCGRASSDRVGIHRSSAAPSAVIFHVNTIFRETYGAGIAVDRFQIYGGKRGKSVFRTIRAVPVVCQNDRASVCNGIDGSFQKLALSEKQRIEERAADQDEKYAEESEGTANRRRHNRPEHGKAHPEDREYR